MRVRLLFLVFFPLLPVFSEVHAAPGKVMEAEPPGGEPRNALDLARDAYPLSARYEFPTFSADEQRRIRELAARTRPMYSGIGRELSLGARNWVRVGQRDGFDVWQVQIRSPQAVELQVHFSDFDLAERSFVNVYSMAATRRRVQRYSGRGAGDGGRFWSQPTAGDVVVVEFWTPTAAHRKPHAFPFANARVSHTFRREDGSLQGIAPAPGADAGDGGGVGGAQDTCIAFNSVCDYPQASTRTRRSTARYWTVNSRGRRSGACSGALIDNERGDGTLYFLTAWHCVDDVVGSVGTPRGKFINATFEFSKDSCGSALVTGANARFIAGNERGDYALLRVEGSLVGTGSYALSGWNPDFQSDGSTVSIVHHASAGQRQLNNQKYAEATIDSRWHVSRQTPDGRTAFRSSCSADGCSHYYINYTLGKGTGGASGASVVRGGTNAARIVGVLTHADPDSCHGNASAFAKIYEDGRVRGALTYGAAYYKGDGAAAGFDDSARPDYEYVGPRYLYPIPEGSVPVGGSVTGTIEHGRDSDWFSVSLEQGRLYRFDLEGADSQRGTLADPHLRLLRADRRTLAANDDGGHGHNARLGYVPPVAADYFLWVQAVRGTGTYTLSATQARDDVAGGRETTATIVAATGAAATATGVIDFPGDEDWFRVTLAAGRRYRFDLEGAQTTAAGTLIDPFLSVRGSDGEPLLHSDDIVLGLERNSRLSYAPPASGLYYLVADAWNDVYVGSYTLTVAETSNDRSDDYPGRRDTTATIAVASATTGTIDFHGDRDWFGATLEAGRGYRFDLQGSDSARGTLADPYLRVMDASGALLHQDDDGGGGRDARVGYVARTTGLHYLVAGAYRDAGVGTYVIEASPVAHRLTLNGDRAPLAEGDSRDYEVVLGLPEGTTLSAGVAVRWILSFDGAGAGAATPPDFIAASGTVAFAAGDAHGATGTFTVTARDDDLNEGGERYSIYLQAPDGRQFFAGGAIDGTIEDDDTISLTLPARSLSISEGQQTPAQAFTLAGAVPTADVVLPYTVYGVRVTASDYALEGAAGVRFTAGAAIISATAAAAGVTPTFVVRALEDGIGEGRERMVIVFDGASARSAGSVAADTAPLYVNVEANGVTQVTVHARVFLQGAYDAGSRTMKTAVIDRLPARQPYGAPPWSHPQTVGVPGIAGGFGLSDAAPDAVDWMLVELRTSARGAAPPSAEASQLVERKAGLLLRDGDIAGIDDGASSAAAAVAAAGVRLGTGLEHRDRDLYVLLHHRNHLPVMSARPATSGNCGADYCVDFTVRQSYGNNQRQLAGGTFGMIAGDVNRDGTIDSGDAALIRANNLTVIGNRDYDPVAARRNYVFDADLDFDGEVLSLDRFFVISNDGALGCGLCRP